MHIADIAHWLEQCARYPWTPEAIGQFRAWQPELREHFEAHKVRIADLVQLWGIYSRWRRGHRSQNGKRCQRLAVAIAEVKALALKRLRLRGRRRRAH
jgi:hypothetical protein